MKDFSHLTAERHEDMRQNDATGEHARWEDQGQEHDREMLEARYVDLPEAEREAFRHAFKPPFDDFSPASLCTCDTYPLPIEDHGDECAVRALYEGWMARREYSKQREEKLEREHVALLDHTHDVIWEHFEQREVKLRKAIRLCLEDPPVDPTGMDQRFVAQEYARKLERIWSRLATALAENGDSDE